VDVSSKAVKGHCVFFTSKVLDRSIIQKKAAAGYFKFFFKIANEPGKCYHCDYTYKFTFCPKMKAATIRKNSNQPARWIASRLEKRGISGKHPGPCRFIRPISALPG
jgi:hypothetical protein